MHTLRSSHSNLAWLTRNQVMLMLVDCVVRGRDVLKGKHVALAVEAASWSKELSRPLLSTLTPRICAMLLDKDEQHFTGQGVLKFYILHHKLKRESCDKICVTSCILRPTP